MQLERLDLVLAPIGKQGAMLRATPLAHNTLRCDIPHNHDGECMQHTGYGFRCWGYNGHFMF